MSKDKTKQDSDLAGKLNTIELSVKALHRAKSKGQLSPNDQHLLTLSESVIDVVGTLSTTVSRLTETMSIQRMSLESLTRTNNIMVDILQKMTGVDIQSSVSESHAEQEDV